MATYRRFFIDKSCLNDGIVTLEDGEFNHMINVLRCHIGDTVVLLTGDGDEHIATISEINKKSCVLNVQSTVKSNAEPNLKLDVYVGYTKAEKMELVCQKAVELGANTLTPFLSQFCVATGSQNKTERLNKIAVEASKQCGRGCVMGVEETIDFGELLKIVSSKQYDAVVFCYEGEEENDIKSVLSKVSFDAKKIAVIVGSEGGFSSSEANALKTCGALSVSLGKRILRAETCAITIMSIVMFWFNEMM